MKKRAFVKYSKDGKLVSGSLILGTTYPKKDGLWLELTENLCCDFEQKGTGNGIKKAFVKYSNGHIVPGSLVVGNNLCAPKTGCWREIPVNYCCIPPSSTCGLILCTTDNNKLFKIDIDKKQATELTVPSFPTSGIISVIHNETKMYLNELNSGGSDSTFWEYDITLSPWSATYIGSGILPWATSNNILIGGCMKQNELSKGYYIGQSGTDNLNNVDLTNIGSIGFSADFTFTTSFTSVYDVLQTTDNKLIVSSSGFGACKLEQYDLLGNLEVTVNLPLPNFNFFGVVEHNNEIYIIGSTLVSPVNKLYKVDFESPYNVTFIADIDTGGSRIISVSQIPKCCKTSFEI